MVDVGSMIVKELASLEAPVLSGSDQGSQPMKIEAVKVSISLLEKLHAGNVISKCSLRHCRPLVLIAGVGTGEVLEEKLHKIKVPLLCCQR